MTVTEAVVLLEGVHGAGEMSVEAEQFLRERYQAVAAENRALAARVEELQRALDAQREGHAEERAQLIERATLDQLTGLPNRGGFEERFAVEERRLARIGGVMSLVMVDLDLFKGINDLGGHAAGDVVLRSLGQFLGANTKRETEFAARIGGEEFAVILAGADASAANDFAERLRLELAALAIPRPDGGVVTASIGVATMIGAEIAREALFERADEALYLAKQLGRDRVIPYDLVESMEVRVAENAFISDFGPTAEELLSAIADDSEFEDDKNTDTQDDVDVGEDQSGGPTQKRGMSERRTGVEFMEPAYVLLNSMDRFEIVSAESFMMERSAGCSVAGPFDSVASAERAIAAHHAGAQLLDMRRSVAPALDVPAKRLTPGRLVES